MLTSVLNSEFPAEGVSNNFLQENIILFKILNLDGSLKSGTSFLTSKEREIKKIERRMQKSSSDKNFSLYGRAKELNVGDTDKVLLIAEDIVRFWNNVPNETFFLSKSLFFENCLKLLARIFSSKDREEKKVFDLISHMEELKKDLRASSSERDLKALKELKEISLREFSGFLFTKC